MRAGVLAATAGLAALLCTASAQASFPGRNGLIVFGRYLGSAPGIYTVAPDGTHLRRIVAGFLRPFATASPRWSPDGSQIVYMDWQTKAATPTVKVIAAAGGPAQVVQQAQAGEYIGDPGWTPDGLVSWETTDYQTCVQVQGASQPELCAPLGNDGGAWSSDGRYARLSSSGSAYALELADPSGGETRLAALGNAVPPAFAWAPDGSSLVFAAPYPRGGTLPSQLAVIKADGSGKRLLHVLRAKEPAWSPDGKEIVFYDGKGLALVHADGSHFVQLTHDPSDSQPDWQPR